MSKESSETRLALQAMANDRCGQVDPALGTAVLMSHIPDQGLCAALGQLETRHGTSAVTRTLSEMLWNRETGAPPKVNTPIEALAFCLLCHCDRSWFRALSEDVWKNLEARETPLWTEQLSRILPKLLDETTMVRRATEALESKGHRAFLGDSILYGLRIGPKELQHRYGFSRGEIRGIEAARKRAREWIPPAAD